MYVRRTRVRLSSIALAVAVGTAASGCTPTPILFPNATSVAELAPDERIVVGFIQYTNGDLSESLPGRYQTSWPRFSFDLRHVQGPHYPSRQLQEARFGRNGGVFAFRAKRWHLFFDSIMASTTKWYTGGYVLWTLPIGLKLPVNDARCAYVGTIVVHISGEPPNYPFFIWQAGAKEDTHVKATVVDNYERDRAALASYVAGCDLQRALAEPITAEDVRALFGPPPAGQARRAR